MVKRHRDSDRAEMQQSEAYFAFVEHANDSVEGTARLENEARINDENDNADRKAQSHVLLFVDS